MPPPRRGPRRTADRPAAALAILPEGQSDAEVREFFEVAGFEVGPTVGVSLSIAGPERLMKETFPDFDGRPRELSLRKVPRKVRKRLDSVVVERPPDFGPFGPG